MADIKQDQFLNPIKEQLVVDQSGQNMYVPKAGFFNADNWSAGASKGWEFNSFSLLKDLGMKYGTRNPDDVINKDEWNESHPYYYEDIEWQDDLTIDIARNIWKTRTEAQNYQDLVERTTTGGKVARGLSLFGAAAFDPVNLVAAPAAMYAKAGLLGRVAMAGGVNALVETGLTGVYWGTQDVRDPGGLTVNDAAINIGAAALIGAVFPLAGAGLRKLWPAKKVTTRPGDATTEKADYTTKQKQKVATATGTIKKSNQITVNNIQWPLIQTGIRFNNKGVEIPWDANGGVAVTKTDDGIYQISGRPEDLLPILPSIGRKLQEQATAVTRGITVGLTNTGINAKVYNTADELLADIKNIEKETNIKSKQELDTQDLQKVDDDFEIEVDTDGNVTGRVFERTKTGKLKSKPVAPEKAETIIESVRQKGLTNVTEVNRKVGVADETPATEIATEARTSAKKNYTADNQVDASISGQSKTFIENHALPRTAYKSIFASKIATQKDWFDAGYYWNKQGERIDLTTTRVADLPSDERRRLAEALKISSRNEIPVDENGFAVVRDQQFRSNLDEFEQSSLSREQEKDNILNYFNCVRTNK